jgi:hypothetical protein
MKWSRLAYCAAIAALTTFLVTRGTSPWFTVPLAAFAAWWKPSIDRSGIFSFDAVCD